MIEFSAPLLSGGNIVPLAVAALVIWLGMRFYPIVKPYIVKLQTKSQVKVPAASSPEDFTTLAESFKRVYDHVQRVGKREDKDAVDVISKLLLKAPQDEQTV